MDGDSEEMPSWNNSLPKNQLWINRKNGKQFLILTYLLNYLYSIVLTYFVNEMKML